jgi:hypothetical protein
MEICPMSPKISLDIRRVFRSGRARKSGACDDRRIAAVHSASAAGADHRRLGRPVPRHHHLYAMYRGIPASMTISNQVFAKLCFANFEFQSGCDGSIAPSRAWSGGKYILFFAAQTWPPRPQ